MPKPSKSVKSLLAARLNPKYVSQPATSQETHSNIIAVTCNQCPNSQNILKEEPPLSLSPEKNGILIRADNQKSIHMCK